MAASFWDSTAAWVKLCIILAACLVLVVIGGLVKSRWSRWRISRYEKVAEAQKSRMSEIRTSRNVIGLNGAAEPFGVRSLERAMEEGAAPPTLPIFSGHRASRDGSIVESINGGWIPSPDFKMPQRPKPQGRQSERWTHSIVASSAGSSTGSIKDGPADAQDRPIRSVSRPKMASGASSLRSVQLASDEQLVSAHSLAIPKPSSGASSLRSIQLPDEDQRTSTPSPTDRGPHTSTASPVQRPMDRRHRFAHPLAKPLPTSPASSLCRMSDMPSLTSSATPSHVSFDDSSRPASSHLQSPRTPNPLLASRIPRPRVPTDQLSNRSRPRVQIGPRAPTHMGEVARKTSIQETLNRLEGTIPNPSDLAKPTPAVPKLRHPKSRAQLREEQSPSYSIFPMPRTSPKKHSRHISATEAFYGTSIGAYPSHPNSREGSDVSSAGDAEVYLPKGMLGSFQEDSPYSPPDLTLTVPIREPTFPEEIQAGSDDGEDDSKLARLDHSRSVRRPTGSPEPYAEGSASVTDPTLSAPLQSSAADEPSPQAARASLAPSFRPRPRDPTPDSMRVVNPGFAVARQGVRNPEPAPAQDHAYPPTAFPTGMLDRSVQPNESRRRRANSSELLSNANGAKLVKRPRSQSKGRSRSRRSRSSSTTRALARSDSDRDAVEPMPTVVPILS